MNSKPVLPYKGSRPSAPRSLQNIPQSELAGTLAVLSRHGVNCSHFDRLRTDEQYLGEVAESIRHAHILCDSEKRAIGILGKQNVVTVCDASRAWGWGPQYDEMSIQVPYSVELLARCAAENMSLHNRWRLVYVMGYSLQTLNMHADGFFKDKLDFGFSEEDFGTGWAGREHSNGYLLVNLAPKQIVKGFRFREFRLRKADPASLVEVLLTLYFARRQTYRIGHVSGEVIHYDDGIDLTVCVRCLDPDDCGRLPVTVNTEGDIADNMTSVLVAEPDMV